MGKNSITPELTQKWKKLRYEADSVESVIVKRIDYILRTWFAIGGNDLDFWSFNYAPDPNGSLFGNIDDDCISGITVECKGDFYDFEFIDKFGYERCWESTIPIRWLYEDFEKEIRDGKEKFDKKQQVSTKQDENFVTSAKAKLTKKELDALRRELLKK